VKTPAAVLPLPFLAVMSWAGVLCVCVVSDDEQAGGERDECENVRALSVPRKNLPLLVTTALSRARRSSGVLAEGLQ
jgi:hypothetical protein